MLQNCETHSALATHGRKRHKTPVTCPTENMWPVARLLHSKPKFSAEKKTDITSMLKFMPMVDSEFMKALLGNDSKNRMLQDTQDWWQSSGKHSLLLTFTKYMVLVSVSRDLLNVSNHTAYKLIIMGCINILYLQYISVQRCIFVHRWCSVTVLSAYCLVLLVLFSTRS